MQKLLKSRYPQLLEFMFEDDFKTVCSFYSLCFYWLLLYRGNSRFAFQHPSCFFVIYILTFNQVRVFCPAGGGGVWHRQLEPVGHWQVRGHLGEWVRKGFRNPHCHSRWSTRATSWTCRLPGTICLLFGAISHKNRLQTKLGNTGFYRLSGDVDCPLLAWINRIYDNDTSLFLLLTPS